MGKVRILFFLFMGIFFVACTPVEETKTQTEEVQVEETPPRPEEEQVEKESEKEYIQYEGATELPLQGTTGFATEETVVYSDPSLEGEELGRIKGGDIFEILDEEGEWWKVQSVHGQGYLLWEKTLVNLPDLVPSIIYNGINTYASEDRSSGKDIPNVTGQMIYPGDTYNERYEINDYIIPVHYTTALKIQKMQNEARKNKETLIVYEGYRPLEAQNALVQGLESLINSDEEVRKNVDQAPWSRDWFAGSGVTSHQRGSAIDISLAKIDDQRVHHSGDYKFVEVTKYTEYEMPTKINELSVNSIVFTQPVDPTSREAWKEAQVAETMNEEALRLQKYATDQGFTPLASEWWHFNDLDSDEMMMGFEGQYVYKTLRSKEPVEPAVEEEINERD